MRSDSRLHVPDSPKESMNIEANSTPPAMLSQEDILRLEQDPLGRPLSEEVGDEQLRENAVAKLRLLWAKRSWLLRVSAYGLIASTLIAFIIPPRYTSQTRLMPPDSTSSSGLAAAASALAGRENGLAGMAADFLGLNSTSDTFVAILNSRTCQDALIQKFDLQKVYWDSRMEDARSDLASHTSIDVDRKSEVITIAVTDRSPQRAAAMAQAYVDQLNRLVTGLSTSSARRERVFLENRLQTVSQNLETAEKDFSQFASKNTAIDIPEEGKAMVDATATLQGQLIAARSELQGLKQIYTDNNARVRSVAARVQELQKQLNNLVGKGEGPASGDSADGSSQLAYPSVRKLPVLGVTYADLYRQTKVQEAVYETLTQEYELAKVEEAKEIPTVKVLDAADVPDKKSFPPRSLLIVMGTMLVLAAGITWVYVRAAWDSADPADPRVEFAHEVFHSVRAHLPWVSRNGSHRSVANAGANVASDLGHQGKGDV